MLVRLQLELELVDEDMDVGVKVDEELHELLDPEEVLSLVVNGVYVLLSLVELEVVMAEVDVKLVVALTKVEVSPLALDDENEDEDGEGTSVLPLTDSVDSLDVGT